MSTGSIIRAYIALHREGVPLKALDPGERVTLPQTRACSCGKRKPHYAPRKRRWICAACGRAWPTKIVVSGGGKQRRAHPPGERQLDFVASVGAAIATLSRARQSIVLLWHDEREIPHRRGRWRQTEIADAMRERRPRAATLHQPSIVHAEYVAALEQLDRVMARKGLFERGAA